MKPYTLHLGDCLDVLRGMADNSVDAIVCDPPYGLSKEPDMAEVLQHWLAGDDYKHKGSGFMGKSWDSFVPGPSVWREAIRVLKPGGHMLAFFGSRTCDIGTLAIRLAGFEIRDQIMWVYGTGFPKSLDVSKAIDKARRRDYVLAAIDLGLTIPGNNLHDWTKAEHSPGDKWWNEFKRVLTPEQWGAIERAVIGQDTKARSTSGALALPTVGGETIYKTWDVTAPATDAARQWEGWGTALKPAHEPICVARKPLVGTVAANVLAHGTGALNIDGCLVGDSKNVPASVSRATDGNSLSGSTDDSLRRETGAESGHNPNVGRWPANLIHSGDPEVLALFPASKGSGPARKLKRGTRNGEGWGMADEAGELRDAGTGSAARFFYCAKASRKDRNEGLPSGDKPAVGNGATMREREDADWSGRNGNFHPTVKPTDLMAYLCRLVTPPGGVVLDPFMGSGSTGKAAMREGFRFVGIDMTPEYVDIAKARIEHEFAKRQSQHVVEGKIKDKNVDPGQLNLFAEVPMPSAL